MCLFVQETVSTCMFQCVVVLLEQNYWISRSTAIVVFKRGEVVSDLNICSNIFSGMTRAEEPQS